jgi:hypothetical protein
VCKLISAGALPILENATTTAMSPLYTPLDTRGGDKRIASIIRFMEGDAPHGYHVIGQSDPSINLLTVRCPRRNASPCDFHHVRLILHTDRKLAARDIRDGTDSLWGMEHIQVCSVLIIVPGALLPLTSHAQCSGRCQTPTVDALTPELHENVRQALSLLQPSVALVSSWTHDAFLHVPTLPNSPAPTRALNELFEGVSIKAVAFMHVRLRVSFFQRPPAHGFSSSHSFLPRNSRSLLGSIRPTTNSALFSPRSVKCFVAKGGSAQLAGTFGVPTGRTGCSCR